MGVAVRSDVLVKPLGILAIIAFFACADSTVSYSSSKISNSRPSSVSTITPPISSSMSWTRAWPRLLVQP